ncbi:hypothetical protein KHA80_18420 [Anaerobacillus sp. HL2]|nr:hypothetical protein KHA80_18420 [Anaerobacillus sp. HL2]
MAFISIHFVHPIQTFHCDDTIAKLENESNVEQITTVGSFTLPIKREINSSSVATISQSLIDKWKNPYQIKSISPFSTKITIQDHKCLKFDLDESCGKLYLQQKVHCSF